MHSNNKINSCPDHPNAYVLEDHNTADLLCVQCGLVLAERCIDESQDWRNFDDGKDNSRVGNEQYDGDHFKSNILPSEVVESPQEVVVEEVKDEKQRKLEEPKSAFLI